MKHWIFLFFLWLVIPIGFAQNVHVQLSVDQSEVEVGTPVLITISSNVKGDFTIDFPTTFKALPGVQSGMNQQLDYHTGISETVYFITRKGSFSEEGKYSFRATLKTRKKTYKSNGVSVQVKNRSKVVVDLPKKVTKNPVFGTVEVQKKTIYEGESVLVNGKIYTKYDLAVESYQPVKFFGHPEVKDLNSVKDPGFTPVTIQNQAYYFKPFDRKILFFSAPGKYEIGPFKMGVIYESPDEFINFEVNSNKEIIEVLPLPDPAPIHFTGGVGSFKFKRSLDLQEIKQGDVVVMTIEVEGEGNLHNVFLPEIKLPEGVIQYGDPEVTEGIVFQEQGSKGKKIYKFHLQFLEKGSIEIPEMKLSFFDPKEKKYVTIKAPTEEVKVTKSAQFENQVLANSKKMNADDELKQPGEDTNSDKSKVSLVVWSVLLLISAGAFLFLFLKRKPQAEEIMEEPKSRSEMDAIEVYLNESEQAYLKDNFTSSLQKLEFALREMMVWIVEKSNELPQEEETIEKLTSLLVASETARYLQVYDSEELQRLRKETEEVFRFLKSEMNANR